MPQNNSKQNTAARDDDTLGPDQDGIIALPEELEMENIERREMLVNPSDLQDVGDPESGDVGVPGGLAAGGEMGEGGYGHVGDDPWGLELMEEKL